MNARHAFLAQLDAVEPAPAFGIVHRIGAERIEATGPSCTIGALCHVGTAGRLAEVVAVSDAGVVMVPVDDGAAVPLGARVIVASEDGYIGVGDGFKGRAIDALGRPIDGKAAIVPQGMLPMQGVAPSPLDRDAPPVVLETGVRAIDGLLTLGVGQRVGIFAASGVGKTSLIEQIAISTQVDHCVVCLVGERGREVEALWRTLTSRSDADRFTMVAATSDETAALRARSLTTALCLAEHWRDAGKHVLLIIDSVTRYAMALREIGLAAGEPPTVRAFTPNVFAALPRIVERCGAVRAGGAISAIMTVLSETDDVDDPIVETMKSLLDGHIVLSRSLAERGHYPAIDALRSVSRQATRLMAPDHARAARVAVAQLGVYDEARVMIQSGIYRAGSSREIDAAIADREALLRYLQQPSNTRAPFAQSVSDLAAVMAGRIAYA